MDQHQLRSLRSLNSQIIGQKLSKILRILPEVLLFNSNISSGMPLMITRSRNQMISKTNIVTVEYKFYNGADLDKSQYDSVYLYKDQIEQTLGHNLIWKRLDDKKESRILLEHSCNLKDENSWNNIFDWYKEYAVKVYDAFLPYV